MSEYFVMTSFKDDTINRHIRKPEVYRVNGKALPFLIEGLKQDATVWNISAWIEGRYEDTNEIDIIVDMATGEWHDRT